MSKLSTLLRLAVELPYFTCDSEVLFMNVFLFFDESSFFFLLFLFGICSPTSVHLFATISSDPILLISMVSSVSGQLFDYEIHHIIAWANLSDL
jgi:hypothetical protein